MRTCVLCHSDLEMEIYRSVGGLSITSLCKIIPSETKVFYCRYCTHLQSDPIEDIESYYSKEYKILIDSEDEDQLYQIKDGNKTYRFDYQAEIFLSKLQLQNGSKVLDYGCAKASTIRKILNKRPDIDAYLFDVSDMYVDFWKTFLPENKWSKFVTNAEWKNKFNVVSSFFALEHVAQPRQMISNVYQLLKDEGVFYCIVPNVFQNTADLVVADHVNHFSKYSLEYLLRHEGFEDIHIDDKSHNSAFVITARKSNNNVSSFIIDDACKDKVEKEAVELKNYWNSLTQRVRDFEDKNCFMNGAIYGSGFYGTFLFACLEKREKIKCFVDQSPFRQGKELFNLKIVSPEALPNNISVIYVGLNPRTAKEDIASTRIKEGEKVNYFYLC
jgi:SAM-dependent methyltransferase